jgi:hypothetical protein
LAFLLRNWDANLAFSKAYAFAIFVKPAFEKWGIVKRLKKATESGLRSAGDTETWLSTGADSSLRAVGFNYHRLGLCLKTETLWRDIIPEVVL